jgi:hypothetical protein
MEDQIRGDTLVAAGLNRPRRLPPHALRDRQAIGIVDDERGVLPVHAGRHAEELGEQPEGTVHLTADGADVGGVDRKPASPDAGESGVGVYREWRPSGLEPPGNARAGDCVLNLRELQPSGERKENLFLHRGHL